MRRRLGGRRKPRNGNKRLLRLHVLSGSVQKRLGGRRRLRNGNDGSMRKRLASKSSPGCVTSLLPSRYPATAIETFEPAVERHPLDVNLQRAPLATSAAADPHVRTLAWPTSRLVQIAAAVILLLIAGTWLAGVWPERAGRGPRDLRQPRDQITERATPTPVPASPPIVRKPSVENASVSSRTANPAPEASPIERVEPNADAPSESTVVPHKSGDGAPDKQESLSARLERLRTQARTLRQSGQRDQALNAVVQGLQIVPKDPALRTMRDSMLTDAREGAARSRRDALELDAGERAGKAFGQGRENERAAEKLRRAGKIEDATRSFWAAADQFKAAAAESKRIDEKEAAAEQSLNSKANERVVVPPLAGADTARARKSPMSHSKSRPGTR